MPEFADHISNEQANRVRYLLVGYIRQTLTEKELDELDEWLTASDENLLLFEDLTDENNITENLRFLEQVDTETALQKIKARATFKKPVRHIKIWHYAVAASVIVAVGLWMGWQRHRKADISVVTAGNGLPDVAPGGNKATLTLSDGRTMVLDKVAAGVLTHDNGTVIKKSGDSVLTYSVAGIPPEGFVGMNTLTVPRGGQYQLTLPDGTKVWLNAASSLLYPTRFGDGPRKVTLTGEGYFEVTHDPHHPFEVAVGNNTVQVLGTHFNINAYTDETGVAVTLQQGAVKVNQSVVLKPGQQARILDKGSIKIENDVDMETVLGWKNGLFVFKGLQIESIMHQVSRWYNVEVQYDGKVTDHFNATIERNLPVSKLLHLLEQTGRVHFTIEASTIRVRP